MKEGGRQRADPRKSNREEDDRVTKMNMEGAKLHLKQYGRKKEVEAQRKFEGRGGESCDDCM